MSEINMTLDDYNKNRDAGGEIWSSITPSLLPNGEYRHIIKLHNNEDPVGFCIFWNTELNLRMNVDEF